MKGQLFTSLILFMLIGLGCTDGNSDSDDQISNNIDEVTELCTTAPSEVWVSAEATPISLREVAPGIVIQETGVRALRGCESISDMPLAAFNWWTVRDAEANSEYGAAVMPLLVEMGAKLIFTGEDPSILRQPSGATPEGTVWVHSKLDLPLYPSAEKFAEMIGGEAWLEVGEYKMQETNPEDYDFVFMKCFHGCEAVQDSASFLGFSGAKTMAHLFNSSQETLENALEPLAEELAERTLGRIHFAGYAWALPVLRFDGLDDIQTNANGFWNDAAILIELEAGVEVGDVVILEAYQSLMSQTSNDAIVLF